MGENDLELSEESSKLWKKKISETRNEIIKQPLEYIKEYLRNKNVENMKNEVSNMILMIREGVWQEYLKDEDKFHKIILEKLTKYSNNENELKKIIEYKEKLNLDTSNYINVKELYNDEKCKMKIISESMGEFNSKIMPYIYQIILSTTNSRRSRSGKTFESIMEYIIVSIFGYPYSTQANLKAYLKEKNMGKLVDGIIPSAEKYEINRQRCIVISMKTSLRERWQQVIEEVDRTKMPGIHLFTLDTIITRATIENLKRNNINLVVLKEVKDKYYEKETSVLSYEDFLLDVVPHELSYWDNK